MPSIVRYGLTALSLAVPFVLVVACGAEGSDADPPAGNKDAAPDTKQAATKDGGGPIIEPPIDGDGSASSDGKPALGSEMVPSDGYVMTTSGGTSTASFSFSVTENAYLVCSTHKNHKDTVQLRFNLASSGGSLALGNYTFTASNVPPYLHGDLYKFDGTCKASSLGPLLAGTADVKSVTATNLEISLDVMYTGGSLSGTFNIPICSKSLVQVQNMPPPLCL